MSRLILITAQPHRTESLRQACGHRYEISRRCAARAERSWCSPTRQRVGSRVHCANWSQISPTSASAAFRCARPYWLQDGFGPQTYRKYMKFEALIDQGSSVFGYIPNASGAFHALRRELYESVANHVVRDLIDPAQAAAAGKRSVFDRSVWYAAAPWVGAGQVYRARLRITRRALSATGYVLVRLWRGLGPLAVWQFVSHKVLRWLL
jgi:hypothetical protein